ncbi:MAG TPA: FG-GAP-like repeat-containing protein, partial [Polyangiaceae bacterium]
ACGVGANARCLDVTSDAQNCGQCGNVCAPGQTCQNGKCPPLPCELSLSGLPLTPMGDYVSSPAMGDFNHDGRLDVAALTSIANSDAGALSVLLGNGDGTFAPRVEYTTGADVTSLAVGDLNGDGNLDIVTTDSEMLEVGNTQPFVVSVLLGNGDGTFAPRVDSGTDYAPQAVAIGDLNGDGKQDLVTVNFASYQFAANGSASVLLGNGDGTFPTHVEYPIGVDPAFVAVTDLNKDGKLDLVIENKGASAGTTDNSSISVLLGHGDGTFADRVDLPFKCDYAASFDAFSLAVGDLNGDGSADLALGCETQDIVTAQTTAQVAVRLSDGAGAFADPVSYPSPFSPGALVIADVTGDGKPDIVGMTNGRSFGVMQGHGDGTFAPGDSHGGLDSPYDPVGLLVGDLNGDGRNDLVLTDSRSAPGGEAWAGGLSVVLASSTHSLARGPESPVAKNILGGQASSALQDVNGDGQLDLLTAYSSNSLDGALSVLLGASDGTFQTLVSYPTGNNTESLATADFNHDGKLDIVMGESSIQLQTGSLEVWLGAGDGTFTQGATYATADEPGPVLTGDFNGDQRPDLVELDPQSLQISILLGNGDGTFAAPIPHALAGEPLLAKVADFDANGTLDLAVVSLDSGLPQLNVLLGNGDGTFSSEVDTPSAGPSSIADLNADGKPDIVELGGTQSAPLVNVLLGHGDGSFADAVGYPVGFDPSATQVADFDGDGIPDIAVNGDRLSLLRGVGDGTFQPTMYYPELDGPIFAGDLDHNGTTDLVALSGNVDVLLNTLTCP